MVNNMKITIELDIDDKVKECIENYYVPEYKDISRYNSVNYIAYLFTWKEELPYTLINL
jgi:hypothetical protein